MGSGSILSTDGNGSFTGLITQNSKIYVSLGNTVLSFGCFGLTSTFLGYSVLRVLEEYDSTSIIPLSHPLTLPAAALVANGIIHISYTSLMVLGVLYVGYQYLVNTQYLGVISKRFENLLNGISPLFEKIIQRCRYSVTNANSLTVYTIYLPHGTMKDNVRIYWKGNHATKRYNQFTVFVSEGDNDYRQYVSCTLDNPIDANFAAVSYSQTEGDTRITINVPTFDDYLVSNIYSVFCFKQWKRRTLQKKRAFRIL